MRLVRGVRRRAMGVHDLVRPRLVPIARPRTRPGRAGARAYHARVQIRGPLLGALALVCITQGPQRAPAVPHIVVILADDLGYGDVGFQNADAKTSTPRLDALARESV